MIVEIICNYILYQILINDVFCKRFNNFFRKRNFRDIFVIFILNNKSQTINFTRFITIRYINNNNKKNVENIKSIQKNNIIFIFFRKYVRIFRYYFLIFYFYTLNNIVIRN